MVGIYFYSTYQRGRLFKSFISTLNCDRYTPKSGYGEFIVEKFTDVNDKVIPMFEKFKLHGIKSNNYEGLKKSDSAYAK